MRGEGVVWQLLGKKRIHVGNAGFYVGGIFEELSAQDECARGIKDVVPGVAVMASKKWDGFLNPLVKNPVAVGFQCFRRGELLIGYVHFGTGFQFMDCDSS